MLKLCLNLYLYFSLSNYLSYYRFISLHLWKDLMDYEQRLLTAVKVNRMADTDFNFVNLLPLHYMYESSCFDAGGFTDLLHLMAGGSCVINWPFSLKINSLDAFLLLISRQGGARLTSGHASVSLTDGQGLLLNLKGGVLLNSLVLPWNFELFFITGRSLLSYSHFFRGKAYTSFTAEDHPDLIAGLKKLYSFDENAAANSLLEMNASLVNILTSCLREPPSALRPEPASLAPYLHEMNILISRRFSEPFSLSHCEELYRISRYRLCREYTAAFGISPVNDLISHRMENAKKMLLTTDLQIQEISSRVGYENTTHFINLFKKTFGATPGSLRRKGRLE